MAQLPAHLGRKKNQWIMKLFLSSNVIVIKGEKMNLLESRNLETFNRNHVSDEFVKNIISDSENKPLKLWYGFYFTEPDIIKEIPKAGHAFLEEKKFLSKKHHSKLVHQIRWYMNFWGEELINVSSIYEANPPFKFLESRSVSTDKKGNIVNDIKISLDNGTLKTFIIDGKNKSQLYQHNIDYSLNDELRPVQWLGSKNRKVGDKKSFIALSEDSGVFEKEVYEIISIEEVDRKEIYTRSKIQTLNEINGVNLVYETVTNSMNICQEFGLPQFFINAKLESKKKALEKIMQ